MRSLGSRFRRNLASARFRFICAMTSLRGRRGLLTSLVVAAWTHQAYAQPVVPVPHGWIDLSPGAPVRNFAKLTPEQERVFRREDVVAAAIDQRQALEGFQPNIIARLLSARVPLSPESLKVFGEQLARNAQVTLVSRRIETAPGQPRARFEGRGAIAGQPLVYILLLMPDGAKTLLVTYTCLKAQVGHYGPLFDEHAGRVRFKDASNPTPDSDTVWAQMLSGVTSGDVALVRAALDSGAKIDAVYGLTTPLGYAASNGHIEAARYLLQRGADVNQRYGLPLRCALHDAALHGQLPMVRFLVESGADINLRNKHGRTALYYASIPTPPLSKPPNADEIVEFLKSKGGTL